VSDPAPPPNEPSGPAAQPARGGREDPQDPGQPAPERPEGHRDRLDPPSRTLIGTLELLAALAVGLALLALAVWFLFFAHNPLLHG
jgi:hypothetical protein